MNDLIRNRAINAADLLNDFMGDLITGVMILHEYTREYQSGKIPDMMFIPIKKMCLSHLIITLTKWLEFYEKFHDLIPAECREAVKSLNNEIKRRKILDFRNKCIGHVWAKDKNRPFYHSEIMERLNLIFDNDIDKFLNWLNNPKENKFPDTVISIFEKIKDSLTIHYSIKPKDIIER